MVTFETNEYFQTFNKNFVAYNYDFNRFTVMKPRSTTSIVLQELCINVSQFQHQPLASTIVSNSCNSSPDEKSVKIEFKNSKKSLKKWISGAK